jgi:hypothetical protein
VFRYKTAKRFQLKIVNNLRNISILIKKYIFKFFTPKNNVPFWEKTNYSYHNRGILTVGLANHLHSN